MSDWGTAERAEKHIPRLIYRSFGEDKVGKDHFGLTMPGPYVKHQFDPQGIEGVVDKFVDEKDCFIFNYKKLQKRRFRDKAQGTKAQDEAKAQRDAFLDNIELTLANGARSISVDETELWALFRFAEFGAASNAPKNYEILNDDYYAWFQAVVDSGVNLQCVQKMKDAWGTYDDVVDGVKKKKPYATGERETTGFKELKYIVQANIAHHWTQERGFWITLVNCRQNMAIGGKEFDAYTFPDLAIEVFPDTQMEEWL